MRCLRGGGGVGPVIVGPMYRVGDGYVCEDKATEEEKARGPVEPAKDRYGRPLEGFDLRGWAAAAIQGLRGADGTLDLDFAILCGVDLEEAGLQGAKLFGAQLQGADLLGAQLQGAFLVRAQLQGADLRGVQLQEASLDEAQLQGADLFQAQLQRARLSEALLQGTNLREAQLQSVDLREAQLQGANLRKAQLQGANLYLAQLQGANLGMAQLQGADLERADVSVLPKGFLLPKKGSAGETEALTEDRPTSFWYANMSVLPKGYEYSNDRGAVEENDAPRPTNLTGVEASSAIFIGADLRGTDFSGTTIGDAAFKDATFAPFRPPERPASGALSAAWRAKALLGSVGRAVVAADDDDDDDDDSDGESEEEEKSLIEAEVEKSLDNFMDKLATGAKIFLDEVDKLLGLVKLRMDTILASDGILAKLFLEMLEEGNVTQASFNGVLSTEVIRPLYEELEKEFLKLLKPTDEMSVGADANADPAADSDADAEVPNEAALRATDSNANDELLRQLLET